MATLGVKDCRCISLGLVALVLLRKVVTSTADCDGCQASSWTSNGTQVATTCRKVKFNVGKSCSGMTDSSTEPLSLLNFTIELQPDGGGFRALWSTYIQQDAKYKQASFVIERLFENRSECFTLNAETANVNFINNLDTVRFDLECSESLTDNNYELHAYSLTDTFRSSAQYSFHGAVQITRDINKMVWKPSVLFQEKEMRCSTSERNLSVTFTLPKKNYPSFEVVLCPNSDCSQQEPNDRTAIVTGNMAEFHGMSAGEYGVYIAPTGFRNAVDQMKYVTKGIRQWDPDIKVNTSCKAFGTVCDAYVYFKCPDPEFEFTHYTMCLHGNNSQGDYCKNVSNDCGKLRIAAHFGGLSNGVYTLAVQASSNCHLWNSPYTKVINIQINATEYAYILIPAAVITAALGYWIRRCCQAHCRKRSTADLSCIGPPEQAQKEISAGNSSTWEGDALDVSSFLGLVCGRRPKVLIIYAQDHEQHVKAVKCLSDILVTYGGCHVEGGSLFHEHEAHNNNWFKERLSATDAVLIVDSPAACLTYDAFLNNRFYRKYEKEFPTHYNLLAVLSHAEKTPHMKKKMARVTTCYSYPHSKSSIGALGLKEFAIPKDLGNLLYFAYEADQTSCQWPCKEVCLRSTQYKKMIEHLMNMEEAMREDPDHFQNVYGPLESNTDSGYSASVYEQWLRRSIDETCGTDIFTIGESSSLDYITNNSLGTYDLQRPVEAELSTAMPNVEDIWRQFANGEAALDDRLISAEGLKLILQRMNSNPQGGPQKSSLIGDQDVVDDPHCLSLFPFLGTDLAQEQDSASCMTNL